MSQEQAQHISSADQEDTAPVASGYGVTAHHGEEGGEHIHLPGPSYWPILLAASIALTMAGLIINISIAGTGLLLAFIFGIGWGLNWGLEGHKEATTVE